jgi:flagellar protein FlgJ
VTASVHTSGGSLNLRTAPNASAAVAGKAANGSQIIISCQVSGQTVSGTVRTTALWDRLTNGRYVSHAYVDAASALPSCTPPSRPVPVVAVAYPASAKTGGGPLNIRNGPSTSATMVGSVADGGAIVVNCAVSGDNIEGTVRASGQWDRLSGGNYVSHAYVQLAATLPNCSDTSPVTDVAGPVSSQTNAQFIAAAVAPAQQGYREFNVPASVTIAQAILESGWGRSGLARNDRNYFGIKCFSGSPGPIGNGCHTYSTSECTPTCYATQASFRTYASIMDSFRDHGRFLTTNSRYRPAFNYTHNADQFLYQMWKAGYATSPTYVANVGNLMSQYNLYQYDVN